MNLGELSSSRQEIGIMIGKQEQTLNSLSGQLDQAKAVGDRRLVKELNKKISKLNDSIAKNRKMHKELDSKISAERNNQSRLEAENAAKLREEAEAQARRELEQADDVQVLRVENPEVIKDSTTPKPDPVATGKSPSVRPKTDYPRMSDDELLAEYNKLKELHNETKKFVEYSTGSDGVLIFSESNYSDSIAALESEFTKRGKSVKSKTVNGKHEYSFEQTQKQSDVSVEQPKPKTIEEMSQEELLDALRDSSENARLGNGATTKEIEMQRLLKEKFGIDVDARGNVISKSATLAPATKADPAQAKAEPKPTLEDPKVYESMTDQELVRAYKNAVNYRDNVPVWREKAINTIELIEQIQAKRPAQKAKQAFEDLKANSKKLMEAGLKIAEKDFSEGQRYIQNLRSIEKSSYSQIAIDDISIGASDGGFSHLYGKHKTPDMRNYLRLGDRKTPLVGYNEKENASLLSFFINDRFGRPGTMSIEIKGKISDTDMLKFYTQLKEMEKAKGYIANIDDVVNLSEIGKNTGKETAATRIVNDYVNAAVEFFNKLKH